MPSNVMWMRAPSSVSSVMRRSSSTTPSGRLTVQSSPPGSTLPRSLSPSNELPVIGNVARVPRGPEPMFCVGAVFRRSGIRGRDRMAVFLSAGDGEEAARGTCAHPASVAKAASLRTSLRRAPTGTSQDLVDRVDGAFGAQIAARYGEEAIQERVLRVSGLEAGRGPELVGRGVDALAARERRDHLRRPVTKPERGHVDEGAVVGLECEAQVELEDAVSPEKRPVTATGQHLSAQPRALEVAARYRCGDASTVRHCADFLYADDCDLQRHQQPGIHSSSPSLFGWMVAPRNPRRLTFSADADSGFQLRTSYGYDNFPGCRSYSRDDPDADRGELAVVDRVAGHQLLSTVKERRLRPSVSCRRRGRTPSRDKANTLHRILRMRLRLAQPGT